MGPGSESSSARGIADLLRFSPQRSNYSFCRRFSYFNPEDENNVFTRDEISATVQSAMLAGLKDLKGESSVLAPVSSAEKKMKSSPLLSSAVSNRKEFR